MEKFFEPTTVIDPGQIVTPKEGTIGYVKVENIHYEGPELEPRVFEVGSYEFEHIG